jgi:hypothetical protein
MMAKGAGSGFLPCEAGEGDRRRRWRGRPHGKAQPAAPSTMRSLSLGRPKAGPEGMVPLPHLRWGRNQAPSPAAIP